MTTIQPKHLNWLLGVSLLLWIVPFEGKRHLPELFGGWQIQFLCSGFLSLALAVGLFLSLKMFFLRPELRRRLFWTTQFFVLVECLMIAVIVVYLPLLQRFTLMHAELVSESQNGLSGFLQSWGKETSPQERLEIAGLIYSHYGVAIPVQDVEGRYTLYQPNDADLKKWAKTEEANKAAKNTQDMLDGALRSIFLVAVVHVVILFSVFTIGLAVLALRAPRTT